jgi:hypothetical protein
LVPERHLDADVNPGVALAEAITAQQRVPGLWNHDAALNEPPKKIDLAIGRG